MIRALFAAAKTFVVVKAVDAVIDAFTKPRAKRTGTAAAPARRAATKSRPTRAAKRRAAAA